MTSPDSIIRSYLVTLDQQSLKKACQKYRHYERLCDEVFWCMKVKSRYGPDTAKFIQKDGVLNANTWKDTWELLNDNTIIVSIGIEIDVYTNVDEVLERFHQGWVNELLIDTKLIHRRATDNSIELLFSKSQPDIVLEHINDWIDRTRIYTNCRLIELRDAIQR